MEELKLIKEVAPYLIPFFGVLFLIIYVKKYLFQGMMSLETYKEQMERERLVLLHYTNITSQLDDILKCISAIVTNAGMAAHKMEDLARAIDESVVNQILRLSPEEREIIKDMRNRQPAIEMLKQHNHASG